MNRARLKSLLENSDGKQYVLKRPKRKDDHDGYEFDKGSEDFKKPHTNVDVTTEDEYDDSIQAAKSAKQSRSGYDHSKNGDKNPDKVDGKYAKMGGHGGSTKRSADKTDGDKAIPKLRNEAKDAEDHRRENKWTGKIAKEAHVVNIIKRVVNS